MPADRLASFYKHISYFINYITYNLQMDIITFTYESVLELCVMVTTIDPHSFIFCFLIHHNDRHKSNF